MSGIKQTMIKVIKNKILGLAALLCAVMAGNAYGQDYIPAWKLSVGGGYMNYFGDVSPYTIKHWEDWDKVFKFFQYNKYYVPSASFGISLERYLSPGVSLMLQLNQGTISMSDRYREPNGTYDKDALHWNRALNFKTSIQDAGLAFVFRSNNGRMFPVNSALAPYFFLGGGVTHFNVKGDLYDQNGNPYNYADPNVQPDGVYETSLRPLMTETSKEYPDVVPYVDAGLGLSINMGNRVSLSVQTDVKYAFSDYLDDVSGKYKEKYSSAEAAYAAHPGTNIAGPNNPNRGNNDGVNDFYIFNKVALSINIGNKSNSRFHAPAIYLPGPFVIADTTHAEATSDSALAEAVHPQDTASENMETDLQQIKSELISLRFAHIDQNYIIRQNAAQSNISALIAERDQLRNKGTMTRGDSLLAQLDDYKIDSLNNELDAIYKARLQLRKEMAYSPIVTEYDDSTKIMIYKGAVSPDSGYLPVLGSGLPEEDSLMNPAVGETSVHDENYSISAADSIRYELAQWQRQAVTSRDTALYQQLEIMKQRLDSVEQRSSVEVDSGLDSLTSAYYIQRDSLRIIELNRRADSLRRLNLMRIQSDSIRMQEQQPQNRNFIQRFFDRFKRKQNTPQEEQYYQPSPARYDTTGMEVYPQQVPADTAMSALAPAYDTSAYNASYRNQPPAPTYTPAPYTAVYPYNSSQPQPQQQDLATTRLLQQNQDEINRLQDQIDRLRTYSSRSNNAPPTVIFRDNNDRSSVRQQRRDRRQAADFNRDLLAAIAGSGQRQPATVSPNIILPPSYTNNSSNTRELDDIRRQLDSLKQQQTMQNANTGLDSSNEQWVQSILGDTSSAALADNANGEVGRLQSKVDSLTDQLSRLKQQDTAAKSTVQAEDNSLLMHYPTVSVYFATGATVPGTSESEKIKPIATVAKNNPQAKILITGFTDGTGNRAVNEAISKKRCEAVKQILIRQYGIQAQRLVTDSSPAAQRGGVDPLKRRVDIKFIAQ